jgi:DNA-binding GntR family transcriptional regulator
MVVAELCSQADRLNQCTHKRTLCITKGYAIMESKRSLGVSTKGVHATAFNAGAAAYTARMSRLSEQLREAIEEEVATGQLLPGTHLDETELASRFGVSRTPIREALSQLAGEGLVEMRPRRGVVAQASAQRLVEMFEVMAELEAMCARLAVRRITEEELQAVEALHEACRTAAGQRDPDAYFYANEAFHHALYSAGHNVFLSEQALALQRKLRPYRRLQLRVRDRMQNSFQEHQDIVDALRAGDTERAVASVRAHVVVQGERFADLLAGLHRLSQAEPVARNAPATGKP